jgi:hypothetical protein
MGEVIGGQCGRCAAADLCRGWDPASLFWIATPSVRSQGSPGTRRAARCAAPISHKRSGVQPVVQLSKRSCDAGLARRSRPAFRFGVSPFGQAAVVAVTCSGLARPLDADGLGLEGMVVGRRPAVEPIRALVSQPPSIQND